MNCNICDREIECCDECGKDFVIGDNVFCCVEDFDKHKCINCFVPVEEGEVE